MKSNLKLIVILGLVVTSLLAAVGVFFVVRSGRTAQAARSEVDSAQQDLERLYAKQPFPSTTNAVIERKNADLIRDVGYRALNDVLRHGQVEPLSMSPGRFKDVLIATRNHLEDAARDRDVELTERFAFGFGAYLGKEIPRPADVARLSQQMLMVSNICMALFESGIRALTVVEREQFEGGGTAPGAPRRRRTLRHGDTGSARRAAAARPANLKNPNAGVLGDNDLYVPWRFRVAFDAKESAIFEVLNRLARDEQYVVVDEIAWRNSQSGVREPVDPYVAAAADLLLPSGQRKVKDPQDRIVSGRREPVLPVTLQLSVFYFAESE